MRYNRDGTIAFGDAPLVLDAPGHARATTLSLDAPSYAPGAAGRAEIHDGDLRGDATIAVRVSEARESGGAVFDDAPDVLAVGATASQTPASSDPQWHAYVTPARSQASDIFAAERPREVATTEPALAAAAPQTLFWRIEHGAGRGVDFVAPTEPGHYVLSILEIASDGDVGTTAIGLDVK